MTFFFSFKSIKIINWHELLLMTPPLNTEDITKMRWIYEVLKRNKKKTPVKNTRGTM